MRIIVWTTVCRTGSGWQEVGITPTAARLVNLRFPIAPTVRSTRGTPVGIRYIYERTLNANSRDVNNNPFPSNALLNNTGFSNIPNNFTTIFDVFKRKSFNTDVSYFTGNWWG